MEFNSQEWQSLLDDFFNSYILDIQNRGSLIDHNAVENTVVQHQEDQRSSLIDHDVAANTAVQPQSHQECPNTFETFHLEMPADPSVELCQLDENILSGANEACATQEEQQNSKRFHCDQCDKTFTHGSALKRHIRQKHQMTSKVNCSKCGIKISRRDNLKRHELKCIKKKRPSEDDGSQAEREKSRSEQEVIEYEIVYEALHRLQWKGFRCWLLGHDHPVNYVMVVNQIMDLRSDFSKEKFHDLLSMEDFVKLMKLYQEYSSFNNGPMKVFWNSYLEMVEVLLNAIRATREGNWKLHINSAKEMLPWFFAYDHTNYSRYLPVYLAEMMLLSENHKEAHNMLANGDIGVQRTTNHGFSQVPVDQTIEQTLNRSTKTKGGIVGFSLKKAAVQRWMLTAHSRAVFVDKCRSMTASPQEKSEIHKENGLLRIKRDEEDVEKVVEVIESWRNPFDPSEELVVLSSGRVADEGVKQDLLMAKKKGKQALESFVSDRLVSNSTGFFETLPKLKLRSFRDAQKKTSLQAGGRNIIIKADRNLFARLLIIGQSRKIDLRELLSFELGPLPWSLASIDGSLAKTNKAVLPKLLEDGVELLENLPAETTALVIDAMALLQSLVKVPDRFGLLAEMVMKHLLAVVGQATRIDFVADQYPDVSIKNTERDKRGSKGQLEVDVSSPQQLCPRQWKKFMANGSNKTSLLNFLVAEWTTNPMYVRMIGNRTLFVTHGQMCTRISTQDGSIVSEISTDLCSNQEEADTRMFLHTSHASQSGHRHIAIRSSDTDVEVLACYYQTIISSELILISGNQTRTRLIHVPRLVDSLGEDTCRVLPSLHALTGCDTVSSFATKGKKKALGIVQQNKVLREAVGTLGERIPIDDLDQLERFVCFLYNDPKCESVNELRYKIFCKGKNLQSHQLPPSRAALVNHLNRANFQAYL